MQLFYHVTRDIELPRAGSRTQDSRPGRACEACGRALAVHPADSESGAGPSLSFCADCRDRLDRSAIQIHFCDQCGVSLPLEQIQSGSALARDGRILCPNCRRMSRIRSRSTLLWVVAAIAAVAAGVAAAVFVQ